MKPCKIFQFSNMKGKNYLEEKKVHQWHIFALQSFHKRGSLLLPKAKDMEFMLKQNRPFPSWGLERSRAIRCGHDAVEVSIRGCKCADPARQGEATRGKEGKRRGKDRGKSEAGNVSPHPASLLRGVCLS